MGLFDFIKGKKSGSKEPVDQLALLGTDESRTQEFLKLVAASQIWVLGEGQETDIEESETANANKLTAQLEKQLEESKNVKTTADLKVYTFKVQNYTVLPFFTSQEFIGIYVERSGLQTVTTFVGYECASDILVREDLWRLPAIMNPQARLTRVFSAEDKVALVKLLSAQQE